MNIFFVVAGLKTILKKKKEENMLLVIERVTFHLVTRTFVDSFTEISITHEIIDLL